MTHGDDDGLIIRAAGAIARRHLRSSATMKKGNRDGLLQKARAELKSQIYDGAPVRVQMDVRDLRGGEKSCTRQARCRFVWNRPRDVAAIPSSPLVAINRPTKKPARRAPSRGGVSKILAEIQQNLFDRALAYRKANTRKSMMRTNSSLVHAEKRGESGDHGGFALSHVSEGAEAAKVLGD